MLCQFRKIPVFAYLAMAWILLFARPDLYAQGAGAAAVSSQTRQDLQLRQQLKESDSQGTSNRAVEEESVTAKALPEDMGNLPIMTEPARKPCFYLTVDTQAFYNSNVLYAESGGQKFAAWQIITTPEIGFAPSIQEERYSMFFPRLGFRYQFFTYAQSEPGSPPYNSTGISANNFQVMNPFASLGWSFSDDLYLTFSANANLYQGSGRDWSAYANFLDEYPLSWQATWFKPLADWNSINVTGYASYVLANPTNFTRTDNNLTLAWVVNPLDELGLQAYASFRLAKYTGTNVAGQFDNSDRLDFQQTYGFSATYTPVEYLSIRAFVSWTKSDSSVAVAETGDFEALNAGTGLNLIYRF
ncbi:MAG: hypothetical protein EBZ83_03350 [Verrucomicrobia bacterium]|nr:hypothetical protein [Verrucomicrobiota bacterium]NDC00439.1 hypothetical protein [Verrucomicrobiota bacterium]